MNKFRCAQRSSFSLTPILIDGFEFKISWCGILNRIIKWEQTNSAPIEFLDIHVVMKNFRTQKALRPIKTSVLRITATTSGDLLSNIGRGERARLKEFLYPEVWDSERVK